jgi:hypothetical protein
VHSLFQQKAKLMKTVHRILQLSFFLLLMSACKKDNPKTIDNIPVVPGVVGFEGMAAFNNLSATEKDRIKSWNTLFVHQSVGGDLEGGCNDNGYGFDYIEASGTMVQTGLYGGLFSSSNGNPLGKIAEFKNRVALNPGKIRVVCFKFGYADIEDATLTDVQNAYKQMVDDFRAKGIRVLHITPPLVYDVSYNSPKMQMRTWMLQTFTNDMIFDLQDIESRNLNDGTRCEQSGVWQICSTNRSTAACPSAEQGIDTPQQGHLCSVAATKISKAFLYAIYKAGI